MIELINICKSFGAVRANDDICLRIHSGTIHGILGENGAGKSTLLKILSGFTRAEHGEICLHGRKINLHGPADATRLGIGMLHQDPLDFPGMRVIDNFLLGRKGSFLADRRQAARELGDLSLSFGFSLDPDRPVGSLTVGERQQLELLRLVALGVRILILDEPTTGISDEQKKMLFGALRKLAAEGRTVIFVSHKLKDITGLCGKVSVLRKGKLVGEKETPYEPSELVQLMFGRTVRTGQRTSYSQSGTVLALRKLRMESGRLHLPSVDFDVHSGMVYGLAGLAGSGQEILLRACAGLVRPSAGQIAVSGKDLTGKPYALFCRHGIGFMPAGRLEDGLIPGFTLTEHFQLAHQYTGFFADRKRGRRRAEEQIQSYGMAAEPDSPVESLSGGNLQRLMISLLERNLILLLLEHPTRGLDIESSVEIWDRLKKRCRDGAAIVFISSDLDELLLYSDRIVVFFNGQMSPSLETAALTAEELGERIGGKGF